TCSGSPLLSPRPHGLWSRFSSVAAAAAAAAGVLLLLLHRRCLSPAVVPLHSLLSVSIAVSILSPIFSARCRGLRHLPARRRLSPLAARRAAVLRSLSDAVLLSMPSYLLPFPLSSPNRHMEYHILILLRQVSALLRVGGLRLEHRFLPPAVECLGSCDFLSTTRRAWCPAETDNRQLTEDVHY
ncbi:unnamed protein product, partial [Urochloa humidicola]